MVSNAVDMSSTITMVEQPESLALWMSSVILSNAVIDSNYSAKYEASKRIFSTSLMNDLHLSTGVISSSINLKTGQKYLLINQPENKSISMEL